MAFLIIGNLSKDVFERRTSPGSEAFFLFICLDAIKFSLLTFFSLLKTIYPRVLTKPLPNDAKSPLPVDVRRSKRCCLSSLVIPLALVGYEMIIANEARLPSHIQRAVFQFSTPQIKLSAKKESIRPQT